MAKLVVEFSAHVIRREQKRMEYPASTRTAKISADYETWLEEVRLRESANDNPGPGDVVALGITWTPAAPDA